MNKYESYKDSTVDWIGEIPSHWFVTKFNRLVFFQEGPGLRTFQFTDDGIKVICVTNITEKGIDFSYKKFISEQEYIEKYKHFTVNKGDLLLSSSGNSWGKVSEYLDNEIVILNTSTIRLNTLDRSRFEKNLIKYMLKSEIVRIQLDILMTGSCQPNFGPTHLNQLVIPLPPPSEQNQIVKYIDTKTEQIDTLIKKTQEKINLLKEKRTSLINNIVTKGLNPNVEFKDSNVEWIGKVPKHWDVKKLKYGVNLIIEKGNPEQSDIKISPENVESNTGKCLNFYSEYTGEGMKFISGDVLLNKLRLYLKKIILTEYDGYSMGEMIVLRSNNNLNNKYLFYLLFHQGLIDLLDSQSTGVKLPRVSPEIILNSDIPFPSRIEQIQIVKYLDEQSILIDILIQKEERRVELLKEYRQTLISDVVTGKIKVCD